jgi:poly(A) polymerase
MHDGFCPVSQPFVLEREDHPVSRKHLSSACLRTLYGLREAGFDAYVVGGAVRDILLGEQPKDFDVATNATPEQIQKVFRRCRLVGRRFVIAHVRFGEEIIEVTTFRGAGGMGAADDFEVEVDGRIVRDNVFGSIEEDAKRRDFTINALYYNIADFSIVDFVGALDDLAMRQLRLIGDPSTRYREDPVRMLRAARLKAKLGFALEAGTRAPIFEWAEELRRIPPARLFEETLKLFLTGHGVRSLVELEDLGLLPVLLPPLAKAIKQKPEARALLNACLANTDARFAADKPVSAGFLLAALAWPVLDQEAFERATQPEQRHALIENLWLELGAHIALPRRFTAQAREVLEMQPRLKLSSPKRARRLLELPRFRAGFDFLVLRAELDASLADCVAQWQQAQQEHVDLDALFAAGKKAEAGTQKKRRRRSRNAKKPNTGGEQVNLGSAP